MTRVRAGTTPPPCPSPGIPRCRFASRAPFALRKGRGVCLRLRIGWFWAHPAGRASPRAGAGLKPRPYVVSPFAVRRGRGLVSFRACWMVWRTPSMLLMISMFQKRRAR